MNAEQAIHSINWTDYAHAYGPADDLPDLLHGLLRGESEEGWYDLWSYVNHQGSVYSATIPTVRVLLTWLGNPSVPNQQEIWSFLRGLVANHLNLQSEHERWYSAAELNLSLQVRQAVLEGLEKYIALAADQDETTRLDAYRLLAKLNEHQDRILPILQAAEQSEPNAEGKRAALTAQATLLRHDLPAFREARSALLQHCLTLMTDHSVPSDLRAFAAQAYAKVDPATLPESTPQLFIQEITAHPERYFYQDGSVNLFTFIHPLEQRLDLKQQFAVQLLRHSLPAIRDHALFIVRELATENRSLRPWAVQMLLQHLLVEQDASVLRETAATLGQMGRSGHLAAANLLEMAAQPTHPARLEAALALLQLRRPEGRAFIEELLASQDVRHLSQTAQLLNELNGLTEYGKDIAEALLFIRRKEQAVEEGHSVNSADLPGFRMTALYNLEKLAERWAPDLQSEGGPTLLSTFREAEQERETTSFNQRVSQWKMQGETEEDLNALVQEVLESESWQSVMLEGLLPVLQPGSDQALLLAPRLRVAAENDEFGLTWARLHAAVALARLADQQGPLQQLWPLYLNWPYLYSEHSLNQLQTMQAGEDLLRPVLNRMAYGERYTTGSFGLDTVQEDEELQDRAKRWLEQLNAGTFSA